MFHSRPKTLFGFRCETSLENYLLHRTKTKPNNWHENVGLSLHPKAFGTFGNILIISASHLMVLLMPCHPKTIKKRKEKYLIIEKKIIFDYV
jgi:hypothetical protein